MSEFFDGFGSERTRDNSDYHVGAKTGLGQCFPTFLGIRHPAGEKYNLWHPVASP